MTPGDGDVNARIFEWQLVYSRVSLHHEIRGKSSVSLFSIFLFLRRDGNGDPGYPHSYRYQHQTNIPQIRLILPLSSLSVSSSQAVEGQPSFAKRADAMTAGKSGNVTGHGIEP